MDFDYNKIKLGNWLFRNAFPLYRLAYFRFKRKNDADEIAVLKNIIRPGMVVLDIGANIGFYAGILSKLVGKNGHVICFEPDGENFGHLQRITKALRNVQIHRKAVSDDEGKLKIYRSKLLNVDHRTYPVSNYDSVEETEAVSIDLLLEKKEVPHPDVIKIDIQGYEMAAFRGMRRLLASARHLHIVAEYWPHGFKRAGTSALEFFDFFTALGYDFKIISQKGLEHLGRSYVEQNNDQKFEFSFNVLISKLP